jgi:hypothetical protein
MIVKVVKYVFTNFKNKTARNVKVRVYANIIVEKQCVMNVVINQNFVNIIKKNIIALSVKNTDYVFIINRK